MPSKNQLLHQAARHLVVGQAMLHGFAAEVSGPYTRAVVNGKVVHVFSRTPDGAWQATQTPPVLAEAQAVVFVDIRPTGPEFYILDADEVREGIESRHASWLAEHGGKRPRNPASTHKRIDVHHIAHGRDRWRLLG